MAPNVAARRQRVSEGDVRFIWDAFTPKQRRAVLGFADQDVVNGVKASVRAVARDRTACNLFLKHFGSPSDGKLTVPDADNALMDLTKDSLILKGFEFGQRADSSGDAWCMMVARYSFVDGSELFDSAKKVLPDFLSSRVNGKGRFPQSRSSWKDLWTVPPKNVNGIDLQLCKLIEQALWAMASDSAIGAPPQTAAIMAESLESVSPSARSEKRRRKRQRALTLPSNLDVSPVCTDKQDVELCDSETCAGSPSIGSPRGSTSSTPRSPQAAETLLLWDLPALAADVLAEASVKNSFLHFEEFDNLTASSPSRRRASSWPPPEIRD